MLGNSQYGTTLYTLTSKALFWPKDSRNTQELNCCVVALSPEILVKSRDTKFKTNALRQVFRPKERAWMTYRKRWAANKNPTTRVGFR